MTTVSRALTDGSVVTPLQWGQTGAGGPVSPEYPVRPVRTAVCHHNSRQRHTVTAYTAPDRAAESAPVLLHYSAAAVTGTPRSCDGIQLLQEPCSHGRGRGGRTGGHGGHTAALWSRDHETALPLHHDTESRSSGADNTGPRLTGLPVWLPACPLSPAPRCRPACLPAICPPASYTVQQPSTCGATRQTAAGILRSTGTTPQSRQFRRCKTLTGAISLLHPKLEKPAFIDRYALSIFEIVNMLLSAMIQKR